MAEKYKYVAGKGFKFSGIFNYSELYRILDVWFRDKFFDKFEKRNEEFQNPDGSRQLEIELTPWKKYTDYYKAIIKIEMLVKNMKNVEIEKDGKKIMMQKGDIQFKMNGYLVSDYENRWNTNLQYFFRDIFDKFIYRRVTKKYIDLLIDDCNEIYNTLTSYLNIHSYKLAGGER